MKLRTLLFIVSGLITSQLQASSISYEQVVEDVSNLASDEFEGRQAGTKGIQKAADYISSRFSRIGLSPLAGEDSFKQSFEIYKIVPENYDASINGNSIDKKNVMIISNHEVLNWNEKSSVKKFHISKSDNFQEKIRFINQQKNDIIVTIDNSHLNMFSRYRNHFMRGVNRFSVNEGYSAVFLVSKEEKLNSFKVVSKNKVESKKLSNVAAILPGKSKADEFVLFSAHYDSLGVSFKDQKDKIYNGADDDASGTSAIINLAEYFAKKKNNERTLVFVAFTAEEIGGYGSKYFSKQMDPAQISAMINIEMIGKESKFGPGHFWMTGYERSDLAQIMSKNLEAMGSKVHPDPYPAQNLFYRSDNATLARLGVPAHSFSSSQIDKDQHYHQTSDEVGTLDLKSMHQVIEGLAIAVESIVLGKDSPSRVDTSKVRGKGTFF